MTVHFLIRYEVTPRSGVQYFARCGYSSAEKREFSSVDNPSMKKVTCEKCKGKTGRKP